MNKIKNNNGMAVVEITLIIPIILLVIVMLIRLFISIIYIQWRQSDSYVSLYTYSGEEYTDDGGYSSDIIKEKGNIQISITHEDGETYEYRTEYGKCSDRLLRWQLYGELYEDILCE